ncbi:MAG: hypothetical protein KGJ59_15445, partial [Bacteroidota bacterium]|nr:hypothetical protein [Bacteroidota bacterium]
MMPISIKAEKVVSEIVESVSQQLRLDRRFVVLDYIFRNDVPAPHVKFIVSSSFIEKGLRSFLKKYRAEAESSLKLGSAVLSSAVETIPSATIGAKKFVLCN